MHLFVGSIGSPFHIERQSDALNATYGVRKDPLLSRCSQGRAVSVVALRGPSCFSKPHTVALASTRISCLDHARTKAKHFPSCDRTRERR
jgi:hypothetical protein